MATKIYELQFDTPPENEGQIQTYSYATTTSGAEIERMRDASDGSVHYSWTRTGRRLTQADLSRHGLIERG